MFTIVGKRSDGTDAIVGYADTIRQLLEFVIEYLDRRGVDYVEVHSGRVE